MTFCSFQADFLWTSLEKYMCVQIVFFCSGVNTVNCVKLKKDMFSKTCGMVLKITILSPGISITPYPRSIWK